MNELRTTLFHSSLLLSGLLLLLTAAGCSVIFTSSLTGTVHDEELLEQNSDTSGLDDVIVYLYFDNDEWTAALTDWNSGSGPLPHQPKGRQNYYSRTVSNTSGEYTFNGIIWEEIFPQFGKSGDIHDCYLLFYHPNYGLSANREPFQVVSDVTTRLPEYGLTKIYNTATLSGTVTDAETGTGLANTAVEIWVPESWTYNGTTIDTSSLVWNREEPDSTAVTAADGSWEQEISFPMMPSRDDNRGTGLVYLTFNRGGYLAENASDNDITDGGWDRDGNGSVDADEAEGYYASPEINADAYEELAAIALASEMNSAVVEGSVLDDISGQGVAGVTVDIYVPTDWDYTDGSDDAIDPASLVWPANPDYSLTTDTAGEYSTTIEYPRRPSETDNRGTVLIRAVYRRDTYLFSDTIDGDLTDGDANENGAPDDTDSWDIDGSGSIEEDERYYLHSSIIRKEARNTLATMDTRRTEYRNQQVEGRLQTGGTYINGATIKLWVDTAEGSAPSGTDPDHSTTTSYRVLADQLQDGYFSIAGISWTIDASHTDPFIYGYLEVETGDGATQTITSPDSTGNGGYSGRIKIYPDDNNWVEVTY